MGLRGDWHLQRLGTNPQSRIGEAARLRDVLKIIPLKFLKETDEEQHLTVPRHQQNYTHISMSLWITSETFKESEEASASGRRRAEECKPGVKRGTRKRGKNHTQATVTEQR